MTSQTFPGFVSIGRLQLQGSLTPFEGQQVLVTVTAPHATDRAPADEPPAELNVETEIFAPVPPARERLGSADIRDAGPAIPCLILPEDVPDA